MKNAPKTNYTNPAPRRLAARADKLNSDREFCRVKNRLAGALLVLLSVLALAPAAEAQTPPAFSSNIDTVSPGCPLVTCIQGQFEQPQPPPAPPGIPPHVWYIRARETGTLAIEVRAVSVNSAETGSIIATLFDGVTPVTSIEVPHPTVAGAENIGSLVAAVQASQIYRLEVTRGPHDPGLPEAHHYKLGFSNVLVDVGINTPSFRYLEPELQTFQVNLAEGENLSLSLNPPTDMNPPEDQTPELTVEISRRDAFPQTLMSTTVTLPSTIVAENPFNGGAGTLVVKIGGNTHYVLTKNSSSGVADAGLYFDTCCQPLPPPPPPAAATPKTIGYWKTHEEETASRLPVPLGNYLVDTLAKAKAVLDNAHAKNAHDMLAAQFLAARLNVLAGVPHACIDAAMNDPYPNGATGILVQAGYMGPGTTVAPTGTNKTAVNAVKDILDNFNNNGCP